MRTNMKEGVTMLEGQAREHLMGLLFSQENMELINIKFCRGDGDTITAEQICKEVRSAQLQELSGKASPSCKFPEKQHTFNVRDFVSAL